MNAQEIEKSKCPSFETCSAALCPLDPHPRRYWYANTEICKRRGPKPEWISTQKKIQKINSDPHSYYTQKMLMKIDKVKSGITGIVNVGYSEVKEREWIRLRKEGQSSKKLDRAEQTSSKLYGEAVL